MSGLPNPFDQPRPSFWPAHLAWRPDLQPTIGPHELTDFERRTRKLWSNFHMAMQVFDSRSSPRKDVLDWVAKFIGDVPTGGCQCRQRFEELLVAQPVPERNWFAWSVAIHNGINAKLGKRADWSVDEGRERWARRTSPKATMRRD